MDFVVIAPVGGFGNHVRWLLLLDRQFQFTVRKVPWPTVNFFGNLEQYPWTIIADINDKIEFIRNHVYANFRTWHNWLIVEWFYRTRLDSVIEFRHGPLDNLHKQSHFDHKKVLVLQIDPEFASRSYFKFNPNFNNTPRDVFQDEIRRYNFEATHIPAHKNLLRLRTESLYNPELDKDFYLRVIDFFELENNYAIANEMHQLWYQGHLRAEKQFVEDVVKFYHREIQ